MPPARDLEDLPATLAQLRELKGWTQEDLARASGVRASSICEYETGKTVPTDRSLGRLVAAFGLSLPLFDVLCGLTRAARAAMSHGGAPPAGVSPEEIADLAQGTSREVQEFLQATLPIALAGLAAAWGAGSDAPWTAEDRLAAPGLRAALAPFSWAERKGLVQAGRRFRSWALAELYCADSVEAAADDPGEAVELAELALYIADRSPGDLGSRSSLRSSVLAFLGNARRVHGDLVGGREAFALSREAWPASGGGANGLLDGSRRLELEASLLTSERRSVEALALLDQALAICPRGSMARILVKRAKTLEELDDYEGAIAALEAASPLLDASDEHLLFAHRFNLAENLHQVGRHAEAEPMLPEVRELVDRLDKAVDRVRFRWLEGRIAAAVGRMGEAVAALREVREEFVELGIAYDAALATLELAALLAEEGKTAEVKALAAESAPIFAAQRVERERLGASTLFCRAAEEERLTAALARRLVGAFKRSAPKP
jgi:transcriptional regulator with XRE-family HTH domain